jgi:hypothetical protein
MRCIHLLHAPPSRAAKRPPQMGVAGALSVGASACVGAGSGAWQKREALHSFIRRAAQPIEGRGRRAVSK